MAATGALYEQVTILLTLAVVSHLFIKRFRQPTIIGEIFIGILVGQSVLGSMGIFQFDPVFISVLSSLGAIFLLFLIGLESDLRAIYARRNVFVALGGVLLPLLVGFVIAWYLVPPSVVGVNGTQFTMAAFVGATLTATSIAIAASVLLDLGLMKKDVGQTILGAAVVDDILGLLILSIVVGASQGSVDAVGVAILLGKAVAFVAIAILVGIYLFGPIVVRVQQVGLNYGVSHGGFLSAMAIAFFYGVVAETIGLSAIVGAFLAGTLFASAPLKAEFTEGARYLEAVFTPIFFISLGLAVNLETVWRTPELLVFAIVLTIAAMVTKVVGCAIPAHLQGMSENEAFAVGWGMTPRGEVGLIVAVTALNALVISEALFSVIVLVLIVVSVLPAPLFKGSLQAVEAERAGPKGTKVAEDP
jgi:Kef-type K+ transport system membrane component KefB